MAINSAMFTRKRVMESLQEEVTVPATQNVSRREAHFEKFFGDCEDNPPEPSDYFDASSIPWCASISRSKIDFWPGKEGGDWICCFRIDAFRKDELA